MNALYISHDGLTEPLGQSQILPYIVGLRQAGYEFTIVSAEKKANYELNKEVVGKICEENGIDWQPVFYTKNPPILSTLKDIWLMEKKAWQLHKEKHFQVVHCRSYIASMIGLKMKRKLGLSFIFDMRGFWADERSDGNVWNIQKIPYSWVFKFFKKKEKEFLKEADAIVSLTHIAKEIMQQEWKVSQPIFVVPCTVDTDLFKPVAKEKTEKPITLGYLGSLGTWYLLEEMLDFYNVFLKHYPNSKFKFISKIEPDFILSRAKEKGIDSSHFDIKAVERRDVPKALETIDIGLFFIKPCFSKQASSPVKQGEFMSMGIPVITNSGIGDTDKIIKQYKSGVLVQDFTEEAYEKAIQDISKGDFDLTSTLQGANEFFSLKKGIEVYVKVYQQILSQKNE